MSDLEKILQLVQKNDGYVTTKEVVDNGLNKMALKRLCDGGKLERVSTGYYSLPNIINDEYYKIISKSKNAIFSYTTSLFLHELSDKNHMDKEIYTKALKWYAERKNKDILKLAKYSKKLNIEKEVAEIMQVILQ